MKTSIKRTHFSLPMWLVGAALVAGMPGHAQDKNSEIDEIFSWAKPDTPGCALAASVNGKQVVNRAYGSADLERNVPITPDTIFDAGSLRKQFIAAAVLLLVDGGRVSLAEDVRTYIPELPDTRHKVTVDHLLTHTGGIRDWTGIMPLASGNPDALTLILRQRGLDFPPGEEWSYSNSGYVLLAELVARTSGMSFGEFARERLFGPLGMKSTTYRDDLREVVKNRALAYDKEQGRWRMAMLLDTNRGGGALLTTANDLLIWNDALTSNRLGAFVSEKLQEPAKLNNGRKLGYARGLFVETHPGGRFIWHTGSADGYKSFLGRYPEQGFSMAIMCNSGDEGNRAQFARRVLRLFVPAPAAPSTESNRSAAGLGGAETAGADLSSKAGLFFSEGDSEPLRLIVNANGLAVAGGPTLVPISADRFRNLRGTLSFMSQDEFEVHFLSANEFELRSMEGKKTRYRRAERYAPASKDLELFAGRYESEEIGSSFRVAAGEGALMVTLEHSPAKRAMFRPIDRDIFQASRITLHFHRAENGKIVAFSYSNPVVRRINFTKVSDRPRVR